MKYDADELRKAKALRITPAKKYSKHFRVLSAAAVASLAFCTSQAQAQIENLAPVPQRGNTIDVTQVLDANKMSTTNSVHWYLDGNTNEIQEFDGQKGTIMPHNGSVISYEKLIIKDNNGNTLSELYYTNENAALSEEQIKSGKYNLVKSYESTITESQILSWGYSSVDEYINESKSYGGTEIDVPSYSAAKFYSYEYSVPENYSGVIDVDNWNNAMVLEPDTVVESAAYNNNGGYYYNGQNNIFAMLYNDVEYNHDINADFIDNNQKSFNAIGAVYNDGTLKNINGNFIGNFLGSWGYRAGAAIYNTGTIDTINGDFIQNRIDAAGADGGAIYNSGRINAINGNFISNSAHTMNANSKADCGGAIKNDGGSIGSINGDFIDNHYSSEVNELSTGGAIYNSGDIGNIKGNFYFNGISGMGDRRGGAVYNNENGTIDQIEGDFTGNVIESFGDYYDSYYATTPVDIAQGGALYNSGEIKKIKGNFSHNAAESRYNYAVGGAITNTGKIDTISGNFTENSVFSDSPANGGAIANGPEAVIDKIEGNFKGNHAYSNRIAYGGAISNYGKINTITGDFTENYADGGGADGGAIYNAGDITKIKGNFTGNHSTSEGLSTSFVPFDPGEVIGVNPKGPECGGAIKNDGHIGSIEGKFTNNSYSSTADRDFATGGAIANTGKIDSIKADFVGNTLNSNYTASGGAINNAEALAPLPNTDPQELPPISEITTVSGNFTNNTVTAGEFAVGGAIANQGKMTIVNSNFSNNSAKAENGEAHGGAIATETELDIIAKDGFTSKISGNYVEDKNGKRNEGIYVAAPVPLTLDANSKGKIIVDDQINGVDGYTLAIKGDKTGVVEINNNVKAGIIEFDSENEAETQTKPGVANITLDKSMLHIAKRDNVLDGNNLTLNSGTFNMINNQVGISALNNMTVNGNTDFVADVDLANSKMDRFTAKEYGQHKGKLNVVGMNLLSDATEKTTDIYFAEKGLKDDVVSKVGRIGRYSKNKYQTSAFAPIYRYDIKYENRDDAGYFVFTRHTPTGSEPVPIGVQFNPAIFASPAAAQAGASSTMNQALSFAFEHGETFMNNSSMDRFAMTHENVYALSSDFNENLGHIDYSHENKSVWVKPYSVFESIDLKNGPKVDTISYGTLIGFDSNIHKLKKGWYNVGTAYIGYNGAQLKYSGVDTTLNGGLIGLTETFYKGNFWTALTATVGAAGAEADTMYGKEDMALLMAGIGSKTGYNFEFADGKFIVQPRMFISYSMRNTFDYTNAAGVRIDSDPLHTIQLNPAIKFIGNTKSGWQPYASVGMTWNLLNETDVTANGIKLPEMHTRPYVEYGLGVQKLWNDKYSAYGQAMVRNGGKTGVALTLGFRMSLGEDGKPIERTQAEPEQTTMTDNVGYLK